MKLALFDVDGTLVDSAAMITGSMADAFASLDMPPPTRERTLSIVGLSLLDAMKVLVPDAGDARLSALAEAYKQAFWTNRANGTHAEDLFPGVRTLLEQLRRRSDVKLGIATGKTRRGVDHLLAHHGFEDWFATTQCADGHPSKPHPSMVLAAMAETGLPQEAVIVIGDTSYDMEMARAAGAGAIGVTWGNHDTATLTASGAHRIVSDISILEHELDSLWQERRR